MVEDITNKGGAPLGNQNARKHGFYSRELDEVEKADFEDARDIEGIDTEIALLRAKLSSILRHDPQNIKLIMRAISSISTLARTKYSIGKNDKKGIAEVVGNILKDIAIPMGVGISSFVKKG